jgi:hypothetical protein
MRDFDDGWLDGSSGWDDLEDLLGSGMAECPLCGNIWPEDHMDTDSGDCITCEDARYWVEGEDDDDAQD